MARIKFEGMSGRENFSIQCTTEKAEKILEFAISLSEVPKDD